MKFFEQFIKYLCITGVAFAVLYAIFPGFTDKLVNSYGMIFGPIVVILLLALSIFKKQKKS
jgi:hypothetical protein